MARDRDVSHGHHDSNRREARLAAVVGSRACPPQRAARVNRARPPARGSRTARLHWCPAERELRRERHRTRSLGGTPARLERRAGRSRRFAISTASCGSSTVVPTVSRTSSAWRFAPANRARGFFSGRLASRRQLPRCMIEVAGDIRPSTSQNGPGLAIAIERVWLSNQPGATPSRGGSARTIPLPAAGEVISFDLPSSGAARRRGRRRRSWRSRCRRWRRGLGGGARRLGAASGSGAVADSGGGRGSTGGRGGAGATAGDRPAGVATGPVSPDPLGGHTFSLRLRLK